MPYDFRFCRVAIWDNETALKTNIGLAIELTNSNEEIIDLNPPGSDFHFTKAVIDASSEFPELHFHLEADIDGFFYHFSFWKDCVYVELGAGGDVVKRFEHLRKYAEVILRHGFQIEEPYGSKLLTQDIGFEKHIEEYNKWAGFVNYVRQRLDR